MGRDRRTDELWRKRHRPVSSDRRLYRPRAQGREACRPACAAREQIRPRHQPADGQGFRPRCAADAARPRRRGDRVKRRKFITLLGGTAAWPLAARAQQSERMRRIGVLNTLAADDALAQARQGAFLQGLQQSGWTIGRNVQVEARWAAGDPDRLRKYAIELVALAPDVILASGNAAAAPVLQATRTVPIVFVIVPDPVGAGFVDSLPQPGGNATGFLAFEYGLSGKWLELLKDIAPGVTRVAVLRDPALARWKIDSSSACARKPGRDCGVGRLRRLHSMVRTSARRRRSLLALCHPRMQRWKSCATGKWIMGRSVPIPASP